LSYTKEVSKDGSVKGKKKRSQEEHNEYLIEWNLSTNMFKGGPAFRITTEESKSARTAFVSDTYNVELIEFYKLLFLSSPFGNHIILKSMRRRKLIITEKGRRKLLPLL